MQMNKVVQRHMFMDKMTHEKENPSSIQEPLISSSFKTQYKL